MSQEDKPGRPHYRVLSTKTIWVGALVMAVVTAGSVWLLLEFVGGDPKDSNRLEIIKTAGTILVGTGGGVALLLAARRQRFVELDGTERRITDLQTKAADQLGSDQAAVRLAGLYALERLAQDNPSHRQTIVDVICGYLRMPYTPPPRRPVSPRNTTSLRPHRPAWMRPSTVAASSTTPSNGPREEQQVRLTAQRILAAHLRPDPKGLRRKPSNPKYWPHIDLDLTGATLVDFELRRCRVRTSIFNDAHFTGNAGFFGATFTGGALFGGATFTGGALFGGATFTGGALFDRVTFNGGAGFDRVTFTGDAGFDRVTFNGGAGFFGVTFTGNALFGGATFTGGALFGGATFTGGALFGGATFTGDAGFGDVTFNGDAVFGGATFTGDAGFRDVTFTGDAVFDRVTFTGRTWFGGATFTGDAGFGGATFTGDVAFGSVTFNGDAVFGGATFTGCALFSVATFAAYVSFEGATLARRANFNAARARKSPYTSAATSSVWPQGWTWGDSTDMPGKTQGGRMAVTDGAWHLLASAENVDQPQIQGRR